MLGFFVMVVVRFVDGGLGVVVVRFVDGGAAVELLVTVEVAGSPVDDEFTGPDVALGSWSVIDGGALGSAVSPALADHDPSDVGAPGPVTEYEGSPAESEGEVTLAPRSRPDDPLQATAVIITASAAAAAPARRSIMTRPRDFRVHRMRPGYRSALRDPGPDEPGPDRP